MPAVIATSGRSEAVSDASQGDWLQEFPPEQAAQKPSMFQVIRHGRTAPIELPPVEFPSVRPLQRTRRPLFVGRLREESLMAIAGALIIYGLVFWIAVTR